jgi:hypothetical protein
MNNMLTFLTKGIDITPKENGQEGYDISSRGILKAAYLAALEDQGTRGTLIMDEYFKLLASRRYGKTITAIKQELQLMTQAEGLAWIERTYASYISDELTIQAILANLMWEAGHE